MYFSHTFAKIVKKFASIPDKITRKIVKAKKELNDLQIIKETKC